MRPTRAGKDESMTPQEERAEIQRRAEEAFAQNFAGLDYSRVGRFEGGNKMPSDISTAVEQDAIADSLLGDSPEQAQAVEETPTGKELAIEFAVNFALRERSRTPTADSGLAREIAEAIYKRKVGDFDPRSGCYAVFVSQEEAEKLIASRLSTREQEVGELVEAAANLYVIKFVSDGDGEWEAIRKSSLKRLRAALDKVRGRGCPDNDERQTRPQRARIQTSQSDSRIPLASARGS